MCRQAYLMLLLCTGLSLATPTLAQLPGRLRSSLPSSSLPNKQNVSERGKKGQKQLTKAELPNDTLVIGQDTLRLAIGQLLTNSGQAVKGYQDPEAHDVASYRHVLLSIPKSRTFYVVHFRRTDAADMETEVAASYSKGHLDMDSSRPAVFEALRLLEAANNGTVTVDGNTGSGWVVVREAGRLYSFRLHEGRHGRALSTFPRLPIVNDSLYQTLQLSGNVLTLALVAGGEPQSFSFGFWEGKLLPKLPIGIDVAGNGKKRLATASGKINAAADSMSAHGKAKVDSLRRKQQQIQGKADSLCQLAQDKKDSIQGKVQAVTGKVSNAAGAIRAGAAKAQNRMPTSKVPGLPQQIGSRGATAGGTSSTGGSSATAADQSSPSIGQAETSQRVSEAFGSAGSPISDRYRSNRLTDKRANIWYFGNGAGLDFNYEPPKVLTAPTIHQLEGSAAIADTNGNLLFYTDGRTIWNRQHEPMAGGIGLAGHVSASTAALIVPAPGDQNTGLFYAFTSSNGGYAEDGVRGIHYSLIDIRQKDSLGAVIFKNRLAAPDATERMALVQHGNGKDFWLITESKSALQVAAFLVTSAGVATDPVLSETVDMPGDGNGSVGFLKASADGRWLASTNSGNWRVNLYRFNAAAGVAELHTSISDELLRNAKNTAMLQPYGIEFSRSGAMLYVSSQLDNSLHQFDLRSSSLVASHKFRKLTTEFKIGALQLAPDGKLYASLHGAAHLLQVKQPEEPGLSDAQVDEGAVAFTDGAVQVGLPNFPSFLLRKLEADFVALNFCLGETTFFEAFANQPADDWQWSFSDGTGIQSGASAAHQFSSPGTYWVQLVVTYGNRKDTVVKAVTISPKPTVDLGADFALARGEAVEIIAGGSAANWRWSNGSNTSTTTITQPGAYEVIATNGGCESRAVLHVFPKEAEVLADAPPPSFGRFAARNWPLLIPAAALSFYSNTYTASQVSNDNQVIRPGNTNRWLPIMGFSLAVPVSYFLFTPSSPLRAKK